MSVGVTANVSTGRGGAGNIGHAKSKPVDTSDRDFATPLLKGPHYTTGRGGQGNMAKWQAEESRRAQDVAPVIRNPSQPGTPVLIGRGGGGNLHRLPQDGVTLGKTTSREGRAKERQSSFVGKAKEGLAKLRANSRSSVQSTGRKSSAASTASSSSIVSK